ncbi:OmpA family protein [Anabaenopsis tanganyikae CS-531]|uniref:OmpA family protein n=2 Tax=Anabaenopsis TaxID=110103 RepID=A0ABT6KF20_9CYAN|nr:MULTISPECIES: OmpA family protein [Anabaenopsis]MDB9539552.1 OmpA family protein [Anabaenopsis arnoldii]MDH6091857.1 OmpA family protein [Anabaenopsis arnoldii]MDH6105944.1 OmpA family protein [Anabaenopsis tanganyikae CS-531]
MNNFSDWEPTPQIEEDNSSVLLAIGDMMSGLLMIFALLFITVSLQLSEISEPRRNVIEQLINTLEENNVKVEVNKDTGDITLKENILFPENSAQLSAAGKSTLRSFIPVYSNVILSNPKYQQEITRVVIEGHTSSSGTYNGNLQLSLLRSFAVAEYISSEMKFETKSQLEEKILASGRGEIEANPNIDDPNDRKVIFRLQFKGDNLSEIFTSK